jgi:hypothetical protein
MTDESGHDLMFRHQYPTRAYIISNIDLSIIKDRHLRAIQRARERNLIIPWM